MLNMNLKKYLYSAWLMGMIIIMITACSKDEPYGTDYDIKWPVPTITGISPSDTAVVSSEITITGTGLDKVMTLTIDNRTVTLGDKTETTLKATLPRKFNTSKLTMTNLYRQTIVSKQSLAPKYPDITVDAFPDQIVAGQPFSITGANLDLVTSVIIGNSIVAIASTNATTLNVPTAGLKINAGDQVVVQVQSTYSKVVDGVSLPIDVVE
jgi:hypothetical protein